MHIILVFLSLSITKAVIMLLQEHGNRFIALKIKIYLFTIEQNVVDNGNVGSGDIAVTIHIACG